MMHFHVEQLVWSDGTETLTTCVIRFTHVQKAYNKDVFERIRTKINTELRHNQVGN